MPPGYIPIAPPEPFFIQRSGIGVPRWIDVYEVEHLKGIISFFPIRYLRNTIERREFFLEEEFFIQQIGKRWRYPIKDLTRSNFCTYMAGIFNDDEYEIILLP
jgi:hypothetical protein